MAVAVRSRIIKIGNSQGIRIPKFLLEQSRLGEEVELVLQQNQIVVRAPHRPRQRWDGAFKVMAAQGDDALLDDGPYPATTWDEDEWEW